MASREVFLSLRDVELLIRGLEEKYGIPTADFLRNETLRSTIPEDDVFRWEAFVDHRRELRSIDDALHRRYLSRLTHADDASSKVPTPEDQILLAA